MHDPTLDPGLDGHKQQLPKSLLRASESQTLVLGLPLDLFWFASGKARGDQAVHGEGYEMQGHVSKNMGEKVGGGGGSKWR